MEISKKIAQSIVFEMKKIIEKDLNFIDSNGIIIASTDDKRIGSYHEGGKQVVLKNDIVKVTRDEEYIGAKKGINLPLKFNGELIGVIGISGETNEVEKYGQIIKRMSEILIKEAYILKKNEEENEKEKLFLEGLLFQNNYLYNPNIFSKDLEVLEAIRSGAVIVGKLKKRYELEFVKQFYEKFRVKVKKNNGYMMINQNLMIILILCKTKEKIEDFISEFEKEEEIIFGIGEIKTQIGALKDSYYEGKEALEWGTKNKEKITFYRELDLELIVMNISEELVKVYRKKIFKNLTEKELQELKEIFLLYEKNNGSLQKIAKALFIHINTLQYKLNKFSDKINLDMRKYEDFTKIKIGFMLK